MHEINQDDLIAAAVAFSLAIDRKATERPLGPTPNETKASLDRLLFRKDTLFEVVTSDLSMFDYNELSPYGIFLVQVIANPRPEYDTMLTPKNWLLKEVRHWTGINNVYADHSYDHFDSAELGARTRLYADFKFFVESGTLARRTMLHALYFRLTHEIDPKLRTAKRLAQLLDAFRHEYGNLDQLRGYAWAMANNHHGRPLTEQESTKATADFEAFVESHFPRAGL